MTFSKILFGCFFSMLILISISSFVYGEEAEYKEYTIQKGDTLWDISAKELAEQDPFLWPKIWKENLKITNPDLVYPGQIIKIPLRLLKQQLAKETAVEKETTTEKKEEPTTEKIKEEPKIITKKIESVKRKYLASEDLIRASGFITDYISDEVKSAGSISGSPTGRTMFGNNDFIYIKTKTPANKGDKFYMIRSEGYVKHPTTNKKIGHLVTVLGIIEVVGQEDSSTKALITKSYKESRKGDLIDNYYDVEPIIDEAQPRTPDVSALVIAIQQMKLISGQADIVFIDKGSKDGIELGDLVKVISYDIKNKSRTTGTIQIINVKDKTSTTIVKKSESIIRNGDIVEGIK
jgi:LysM repeat protein